MNKKDQQALDELNAYLDSRSEKTNTQSDKRFIAMSGRYTDPNFVDKMNKAAATTKTNPVALANRRKSAEQLHTDKKIITKRKTILEEIYKTDDWKHAQADGARRNAQENKEWYEKTVERNRRLANDPNRLANMKKAKDKFKEDTERYNEYLKELSERNSRKVITPIGEFKSVNEAAKAHGVAANTLRRTASKNPNEYYFEEHKKPRKTTGKPIMTPSGVFESKTKAAVWAMENGLPNAEKKIDKWLKTDQTNFYYITKEEYTKITGKEL